MRNAFACLFFAFVVMPVLASSASCTLTMTSSETYGPLTSPARAVFTALPDDVASATIKCNSADAGVSVAISRVAGSVYASRICSYPPVENSTVFLVEAEAGGVRCGSSLSVKSTTQSVGVLKSLLESRLGAYFNETPVFSKTDDNANYIRYWSGTVRDGLPTYVDGNPVRLGYRFSFYKYLGEDIDIEQERYIVGQVVGNRSVELVEATGVSSMFPSKVRYSCTVDGAKHNIVAYFQYGITWNQIGAVFAKIYDACDSAQLVFAPAPAPTAAPSAEPSASATATPRPTAKPTAVPTQVPTPTPLPTAVQPAPAPQDNTLVYAGVVLVLLAAVLWYATSGNKGKKEEKGKKKR
ncbi:MAG: hypothetical protein V1881_01390 [Candidatus Micrarchaeota archaeon]